MSISICTKHNLKLIPIDRLTGKCPFDGEVFVLSHLSRGEIAAAFPGASSVNQAYDPIWGASSLENVREILIRYGSDSFENRGVFK